MIIIIIIIFIIIIIIIILSLLFLCINYVKRHIVNLCVKCVSYFLHNICMTVVCLFQCTYVRVCECVKIIPGDRLDHNFVINNKIKKWKLSGTTQGG